MGGIEHEIDAYLSQLEKEEAEQERKEEIYQELCLDDEACMEADERGAEEFMETAGMLVQSSLVNLHYIDSSGIHGTATLENLYEVARFAANLREKHLREMADEKYLEEIQSYDP